MKYGVIGEKLPHSYSKDIFKIIADYDYEPKELAPDEVDDFMKKKEFSAINVTIPYKQTVIPYLDYIDESVDRIGACNVVVNRDGKLYGYNTDFDGLRLLILKAKMDFTGAKVLILGTGGTSHTAMAVASYLEAASCIPVGRKKTDTAISYDMAYRDHADADFIINTTPCGMYPYVDGNAERSGTPIDLSRFSSLRGVVDAVYNPIRTNLVLDAALQKIPAVAGLYMLTSQAILSAEHFTDTQYEKSVYDKTYWDMVVQKENIVLIGMPGSGKTTVGKKLAAILHRPFYDTDEEIVRKTGKSIKTIFEEIGEPSFRALETETIRELSLVNGAILATGGGAILKKENIRALRRTGRLYFLNRSLDKILPTDDRPLSGNREDLEKRYRERYSLYMDSCDKEIKTDESVENTATAIEEDFLKR